MDIMEEFKRISLGLHKKGSNSYDEIKKLEAILKSDNLKKRDRQNITKKLNILNYGVKVQEKVKS